MDESRLITLTMTDVKDAPLIKMRIAPWHRPDRIEFEMAVEEETGYVKLRSGVVWNWDYTRENWLGLLRAILASLENDDFHNSSWGQRPEEMHRPPRSRWWPSLKTLIGRADSQPRDGA